MFICLFVCWPVCFYLNHLWAPTEIPPENFVKIPPDLTEIFRIKMCLFVWLFVCLFIDLFVFILIILGYPQEYTLKISWGLDLIWQRYLGSKNVYFLFVCLLICLFYYFTHIWIPTGIYPQHFAKNQLDLAKIYRI